MRRLSGPRHPNGMMLASARAASVGANARPKGEPAMSVSQRNEPSPQPANGADGAPALYGNAFLLSDAPDHKLPQQGMSAGDALRLLEEELVLDGIPMRNLATFVTTWMEPEA